MRQGAESAEKAEAVVVLQSSDQGVGVGQVQNEGADVGAPEGLERVSLPAGGPVLLKPRQERRVVQADEDLLKQAQEVLSESRLTVIMLQRHLEHSLPRGGNRQGLPVPGGFIFCSYIVSDLAL